MHATQQGHISVSLRPGRPAAAETGTGQPWFGRPTEAALLAQVLPFRATVLRSHQGMPRSSYASGRVVVLQRGAALVSAAPAR